MENTSESRQTERSRRQQTQRGSWLGTKTELDADPELRKGKIPALHSGFLTDPHFVDHEALLFLNKS